MNEISNKYSYTDTLLAHVFLGEIKQNGVPTGYHCDRNLGDELVYIDPNTVSIIYGRNIFQAKVFSKQYNKIKTANGGFSSFFPNNNTRQDILDLLNNCTNIVDDLYYCTLNNEEIYIKIHSVNGQVKTFYPVNPED